MVSPQGVSRARAPRARTPRPGVIALVFLLASVPYILFSDRLLLGLVHDAAALTTWQTIKGWGYVLVAAGVVYLLERRIARRHRRALAQQRAAYDAAIEGWARALDLREHETGGHARRVTELAQRLGQRLGLPELREATTVVRSHHERWDGAGYPDGLAGEAIPRLARIFAVVDVYDALRSDRPYRRAWTEDEVHAHLRAERGRHLDPEVVDAFLEMLGGGA
ncbi:MAG: HD-GYP domain-containing protein [Trueperaceae bacterium]